MRRALLFMPLLDASFPGAGVTFGLQLFARKARFTLAPCVIVERRAVVSVVFVVIELFHGIFFQQR